MLECTSPQKCATGPHLKQFSFLFSSNILSLRFSLLEAEQQLDVRIRTSKGIPSLFCNTGDTVQATQVSSLPLCPGSFRRKTVSFKMKKDNPLM